MQTLIYIDTETGGLDPEIHGLTEVAAIAFYLDGNSHAVEVGTYQTLVRPCDDMAYTPYALNLQGRTLEQLYDTGTPEPLVLDGLTQFLSRHLADAKDRAGLLWAHNAPFDHGFLRALEMRLSGPNALRFKRVIADRCDWSCTKSLFHALRAFGVHDGQWSNLKAMARQWGIEYEGDGQHTALSDARVGMHCLGAMRYDLEVKCHN